MKFLIVMVQFLLLPDLHEYKSASVIAGPYDSLDACESALSSNVQRNEAVLRNIRNSLIKVVGEGSFLQCIGYRPDW